MRGSPFGKENFSAGLNTLDSPYTLQGGEARDCLNVVSTPRGAIRQRTGSTLFASSAVGAFPALAATDNFNRVEAPLSNGGKWSEIPSLSGKGETNGTEWAETTNATEGGYWNVAEQTNPAAQIDVKGPPTNIGVYTCLNAAGTNGYVLVFERVGKVEPKGYVSLVKLTGGVETGLAGPTNVGSGTIEAVGIGVRENQVSTWIKVATVWNLVHLVSSSTYTKGYSGFYGGSVFEGTSKKAKTDNFSVGEMTAAVTGETLESLGSCVIGGTPYLIAANKKNLYSVDTNGVMTLIKATQTNGRWSIVQGPEGTRVKQGPVFLSNGVDAPQYWTGATKSTETKAWTAKAEGEFVEVPKAKYLVYFANRVWASGVTAEPAILRFSGFAAAGAVGEQADPCDWPKENIIYFDSEDGEPITGIGVCGPYLLVFKRHKTWVVYDLNEGENRRISDSVGCVSHRSIVETPQGCFFLTPDQGVFLTNGTSMHEVSRQVRTILQGTDPHEWRAAKASGLERAAGAFLNGHYYLSYEAQDGSQKTLDYDIVLQSWWLHDLAGGQWTLWEPTTGAPSLYTLPKGTNIVKAFVPEVFFDSGEEYTGNERKLPAYWIAPWEPFFQYVMRHRLNAPMQKKRIRQFFFDGSGEILPMAFKNFEDSGKSYTENKVRLRSVVDNADESLPTESVTLGTEARPTQAGRAYALGAGRVWSIGFGGFDGFEVASYSFLVQFRKS